MPRARAQALYLDPSEPRTSLPPGVTDPGFTNAYAEARMTLNAAYAGASKRVIARLVKDLSPLARAILKWMVNELKAARLVLVTGLGAERKPDSLF